MEQPMISIVMPAYNSEKYVGDAIESVCNQTYKNWELIVIDDCSTDETAEEVKKFADDDTRIHYIKNEKNYGTAISRNNGIKIAKGEYIALIDSDDIWERNKLEIQMHRIDEEFSGIIKTEEIEKDELPIILCYTSYEFIDENDMLILHPYNVPKTTNYNKMLKENVIGCSSVVLSANAFEMFHFDDKFFHEDYVLWMRLLKEKKNVVTIGIQEVLMQHRQLTTAKSYGKRKAAVERWKIYRQCLNLSILKSFILLLQYALNGITKYGGHGLKSEHRILGQ